MKRYLVLICLLILILACSDLGPAAVGTPAPVVQTSGPVGTSAPATTAPAGTSAPNTASYAAYLPNPSLTPGDALDVTTTDICVSGYASKVRNVPDSEKNQVYQEYGITSHAPGAYEVDHLISLELGGSNSIKNLWPQSYTGNWNAHIKDKLENKLHDLVCGGQVDLKTAQQEISTDWIAAYIKYLGQP